MRLPIAILLAALALAVAIAGCGSSSDETSTAPAGNSPATTSTAPEHPQAPLGARAKSCSIGRSSGGKLQVTGVSCDLGRSVVAGWYKDSECSGAQGASRTSCRLGEFTCLGTATDRGVAATCSAPGRSIAFIGRTD